MNRAERLSDLYRQRDEIKAQISALEDEVAAEVELIQRNHGTIGRLRKQTADCGTDSGYYRHLRTLGEPACDACKAAHAQATRERTT